MRHLDDGTIHAYLDSELPGAARQEAELHLAGCAWCRARLESEREIKERAQEILAAAAPARLVAPPFGEVEGSRRNVRGRKGSREPRSPSLSRWMKLVWAATVVLALGVGWYARERATRRTGREAGAPTATLEPTAARPSASEAPPAAIEEQFSARVASEPTTTPAERVPAPNPGRTSEPVGETRKDLRALAAMAVESVSAAAPTSETPGATEWTEVDREEAERLLGGPLAGIPGGRTISIRAGRRYGVAVIRTVQMLAAGGRIQLEQTPFPNALALAPEERERAAPPGYRSGEVARLWNGFLIVLRGSVSPDSLRALIERLQRAEPPQPNQLRHH